MKPSFVTRRNMIRSIVGGSLTMPGILQSLLASDASPRVDPLAPKAPHFSGKAKRVIFLYMSGGVSHIESFDPKPALAKAHGKPAPGMPGQFLTAPRWKFQRHGQSGTEVSELFPHIGSCVDDITVIRSLKANHGNHFEATLGIHTGSVTFARPSIGSWVSYGLGTVNQNLPSFMVIAPYLPYAGGQVWAADFLPGCHQGVRVMPGPEPIPNMNRRLESEAEQRLELGLIQNLNRRHLKTRSTDPNLAARIQSFETAFGMQHAAPEAFDLSKESDATLKLYGLERGSTQGFAWQCLIARRLAERGVRFIELIDSGANNNWDSHGDMADHAGLARNVDQPIGGLLKDLKSRGMLEDTLVVWTTEFGRTPFNERPDGKGREHHPGVYSSWLAGAGIKPGTVFGSSDEFGIGPADSPVDTHDLHATILHLLGFDHERLTYRHAGRDFRLTDVSGNVINGVLS